MKGFFNVLSAGIVVLVISSCEKPICYNEKLPYNELILTSIDTSLFYENFYDYLDRSKIELTAENRFNLHDEYSNIRIQKYKKLVIQQDSVFDTMKDERSKAYLKLLLKRGNLLFNDSVTQPLYYNINYRTRKGDIIACHTISEFIRSDTDSAVYMKLTMSNIINAECGRAYLYYEFFADPKEYNTYIVIFEKDTKQNKWKVKKKILVAIS